MRASYLLAALAAVSTPAAGFGQEPEVRPDAARVFPGSVQPVLMNLCARCHARPDHGSGFVLTRVGEGYASPQATARNLRATVAFVRADRPAASPLLAKAATPHGGLKEAPLPGRSHPAFRNLEAWAAAARPPAAPKPEPAAVPMVLTPPSPALPAAGPAFGETPAPTPAPVARPAPKANPDDPFDPAGFNR